MFKPGDIVECVDEGTGLYLQNGKRYTIKDWNSVSRGVFLWELASNGWFRGYRFRLVTKEAPSETKYFSPSPRLNAMLNRNAQYKKGLAL